MRTSRSAVSMSSGRTTPLFRSRPKAACRRTLRVSNIADSGLEPVQPAPDLGELRAKRRLGFPPTFLLGDEAQPPLGILERLQRAPHHVVHRRARDRLTLGDLRQ